MKVSKKDYRKFVTHSDNSPELLIEDDNQVRVLSEEEANVIAAIAEANPGTTIRKNNYKDSATHSDSGSDTNVTVVVINRDQPQSSAGDAFLGFVIFGIMSGFVWWLVSKFIS